MGAIAAEAEDALPQSPIRMDSEEALAKCDENRDMEDGIGSQLVKLQPIHKKQTAEEIMDGSRKAADKMVNEANPIFYRRRRVALLAGEAQRVFLLHQPQFFHQVDVLIGNLGSFPLRRSQILRRHLGFRSVVPGESSAWWHQQWRSVIGSVDELRRYWVQWGIFGARTEVRRAEAANRGGRRPFIGSVRDDAPLDGAVINLMD